MAGTPHGISVCVWSNAGVYREPSCLWKADDLDHAVTLMGYGTSAEGSDYWLIK